MIMLYHKGNLNSKLMHAKCLSKNTRVWLSVVDEDEEAIWKQDKQDGPKWLKSIIFKFNIVVMAGTGNIRRVLMIGAELKESEKLYSSTSITAYFIKVKDTAYKHRLEEKKFLDRNDRYKHLTRDRSEIPTVPKDGNDTWKPRNDTWKRSRPR